MIDIKRMARLGDEKLHLDRSNGRVQLFDLGSDRGEQRDRSQQAPERVQLLSAALTRFLDGAVVGEESGGEISAEERELLRQLGYVEDE